MAICKRAALLAAAGLLAAGGAAATSYVMISDADLADQAEVIAVVRVVEVGPAPGTGAPSTDYRVEVERLLKGYLPASSAVVRVLGGVRPDGVGLRIFAAPRFRAGERALLFLSPHPDGAFRITQFLLGAFHQAVRGGRSVALRDLSEAEAFGPGKPGPRDPARDFSRFAAWLEDRALGLRRRPDYLLDLPGGEVESLTGEFTLFTGCGDGKNIRWFTFQGGGSVSWRALASGQSGMPGGGFTEFQTAQGAWNADANSTISYTYAGTVGGGSGFNASDGVNSILFDDPNGEISGSFSCPGGGVLAIGGPWFFCSTMTYNGRDYHPTTEGDVVIQDGAGCFLAGNGNKNGEEVFAHELGHSLGLGHSDVPGALMRSSAYGDGRGASLGSDDRAAIRCLYGDSSTCDPLPAPPAAPSNLAAAAVSATQVQLTWTDNADNESQFRVELRTTGAFALAGTVGANNTSALVNGLDPSTAYTFRIQACNSDGCSGYSNEASATTPADGGPPPPGVPADPSGLQATALSSSQVQLSWLDNSGDEEEFRIEAHTEGEGLFQEVLSVGADTAQATVGSLLAGSLYTFRVRACNAAGCSGYSNQASATTPPGSLCPPDPTILCLLNDRFWVQVAWRDFDGNTGLGTAVPLSDQSGLFWFFAPSNIEMLFKMIDACDFDPFNNFWVFFAATTNVEFTVTVTDTDADLERTYFNPLFQPADAVTDTAAFATCP